MGNHRNHIVKKYAMGRINWLTYIAKLQEFTWQKYIISIHTVGNNNNITNNGYARNTVYIYKTVPQRVYREDKKGLLKKHIQFCFSNIHFQYKKILDYNYATISISQNQFI